MSAEPANVMHLRDRGFVVESALVELAGDPLVRQQPKVGPETKRLGCIVKFDMHPPALILI